MTRVTKDLSVETPFGRCGFMEQEYQTGSTVSPKGWELYVAGRGVPIGGEHILAVCLVAGILAVLSFQMRRPRG